MSFTPLRRLARLLPASLLLLGFSLARGLTQDDFASSAVQAGSLPASYYARLRNRVAWPGFPLRIYFLRDQNYTKAREAVALEGFSWWANATNGFVRWVVVDDPGAAQVTVRFDPSTVDGYTTIRFANGVLTSADVMIGVLTGSRRRTSEDVRCTAAHELGHALGIDGHSESRRDLIYPSHTMGTPCRVTGRDLNTLSAAYPLWSRAGSNRN